METAEERGRKFLQFVGENESRLRANLAKNVTFDRDLFEDVFSYTIIRVYDSILSKKVEVKDFEQYFFMASRNNYIKQQERRRKRSMRHTGINGLGDFPEEKEPPSAISLHQMREATEQRFGKRWSDIFFDYMALKSSRRINYKEYAGSLGIPTYHLSRTCINIKRFLNQIYYGLDKQED